MEMKCSGSWDKGVKTLWYWESEERREERVVKEGPVGGTYCRGSSQMKHVDGEVLDGYCVPQV
jgi:hypothetical protein